MLTQMPSLADQFGPIDIYLFDQLLRGRIVPGMRIVDAGCGSGRNLVYFLREGYDVFAADENPAAVEAVRRMAAALAPSVPATNFRVDAIESMLFAEESADVALSSAVLHFARDDEHFARMLEGTWRVLKRGGLFFARLASTIGMDAGRFRRISGRRFVLPDGSERYLVDEPVLMEWTRHLGGEMLDPLKTTVVQNQRCMTTWVLRKRSS